MSNADGVTFGGVFVLRVCMFVARASCGDFVMRRDIRWRFLRNSLLGLAGGIALWNLANQRFDVQFSFGAVLGIMLVVLIFEVMRVARL
ncbi:MAG: hypothetical protein ABR591_01280 [Candidatus Velthaea sp.]